MTGSAESNRPTLVKPMSTWVITLKTSPMNPIEPLDQAYTHPWSTLGQRHGQTPLNHWRRWMSSGTIAAFSKIHLNTSESTFMKVVHLVEGQLSCRLSFQILSRKGWKTWSTASTSCAQRHGGIPSWHDVPAKSVEKNTRRPLQKL
jgi:hypothetical protein